MTANEFIKLNAHKTNEDNLIEFAKLHVKKALDAANEEVNKFVDENEEEDYKPQILKCYPLNKIK